MRPLFPAFLLLLGGAACVPVLETGNANNDWVWDPPTNQWPTSEPPDGTEGEGFFEEEVPPDFRLPDQFEDTVALWQFYGLVTVVDISTMWCAPCRDLAEGTETTYLDYSDDGFMYVTVIPQNLDRGDPTTEDLNEWGDEYAITAPIVADLGEEWSSPAVPQNQYPLVLVLDRDLEVQHRVWPATDENLREAIDDVLATR